LPEILTAWYGGTFNILGFALQMILILATGYAIADAPFVQRGLRAMAAGAQTPTKAALVVFPIVAIASWLNWGLGLVVGAFLAREIARRVRVDFAWLVAGSYSAWSVCNSGLSHSACNGLYRDHIRCLADHLRHRALANSLSTKPLPRWDAALLGVI
jgi:short-chain fatty acids transporter